MAKANVEAKRDGTRGQGRTSAKGASSKRRSLQSLPVRSEGDDGLINVVTETSKGSPNKLGYEDAVGAWTRHAMLPQGAVFPFDFPQGKEFRPKGRFGTRRAATAVEGERRARG